ncbi:hypothetical protein HAX54_033983 [Datura stramonium]|uniref:Uncharacterized protein n=1 Tax=Datura stramonium TaxID=4076 RepID=A0ABS8VEJ7_DATST|nr:hypothetical protein [Datura stramonium]
MATMFKHSHFALSALYLYPLLFALQADVETDVAAGQPKKRTFKKFQLQGVGLVPCSTCPLTGSSSSSMLVLTCEGLYELLPSHNLFGIISLVPERFEEEANGLDQAAQGEPGI